MMFKASKNRNGYFNSEDLAKQVDIAINVFESKTNGFATGLFMFDNALSHQKQAADALSACKMPKCPNKDWVLGKGGLRMHNRTFREDNTSQDFYFPDDHPTMPRWFKGMKLIIQEQSLWAAGRLLAQCTGFKCEAGKTDCCCCCLLFRQPDFVAQKSQLKEHTESHGQICDFNPKFHCELNFIEQYWGAVKFHYWSTAKTEDMEAMEHNVIGCLNNVPLLQI